MSRKRFYQGCMLVIMAVGLSSFWSASATAQTPLEPGSSDPGVVEAPAAEGPEAEELAEASNPPAYIADLVERTELTQVQVDQMRTDGAGWGNIRIAALLAEQMAAKSADSDTPLTFDEALTAILVARAEGKGFGEIANENDLKIGQLTRNRNRMREPALGDGLEAEEGVQAGKATQTRGRKRGLFARLAGFLGVGKSERPDKDERPTKATARAEAKLAKLQKGERPERPQRLERPERPEKPEKPAKPEKPEKPERGPRR